MIGEEDGRLAREHDNEKEEWQVEEIKMGGEMENIRRKKEEENRRVEEREEWEDENISKNKLIIVMFSPITQCINIC